MNPQTDLSIVLISRNEATHIAGAIESSLRAAESWQPFEIVLVDSASTDNTIEIAGRYPIDILRLRPDWFLSAGAGRYIGTLHTRGVLIMYMDGDMTMDAGWLDQAIPYLIAHPELAGVTGRRHDVYVMDGQVVGEHDENVVEEPTEVQHFGGAALYRRAALVKAGGFNPFLISEEEPELCMRLRHAGYRLACLPQQACTNYTLPIDSWDYFRLRLRSRMWLGHGQVPRYHLHTGMFWMVIKERGTFVFFLALLFAALLSLLGVLLFGNMLYFGGWVLIMGVALFAYGVRKGSLQEMARSVVHQCCVAYGGIRGFMIPPRPANAYPTDVEFVKVHFHRQIPVGDS